MYFLVTMGIFQFRVSFRGVCLFGYLFGFFEQFLMRCEFQNSCEPTIRFHEKERENDWFQLNLMVHPQCHSRQDVRPFLRGYWPPSSFNGLPKAFFPDGGGWGVPWDTQYCFCKYLSHFVGTEYLPVFQSYQNARDLVESETQDLTCETNNIIYRFNTKLMVLHIFGFTCLPYPNNKKHGVIIYMISNLTCADFVFFWTCWLGWRLTTRHGWDPRDFFW